jgi:hypothetical protein
MPLAFCSVHSKITCILFPFFAMVAGYYSDLNGKGTFCTRIFQYSRDTFQIDSLYCFGR